MHKVEARFERIRDIHLGNLFGAVGVYVLWEDKEDLVPLYIGQGEILKRLGQHAEWCKPPADGYIAVLGDFSEKGVKEEAEMVEAALLAVCEATSRDPDENRNRGNHNHFRKLLRKHNMIRVSIKGWDPLRNPAQPNKLSGARKAKVELDNDDEPFVTKHDWRKLRGAD